MVGTTRSHVGFFMNNFRKLEVIEYIRRVVPEMVSCTGIVRSSLSCSRRGSPIGLRGIDYGEREQAALRLTAKVHAIFPEQL
jgi:hypothetical protein